MTIDKSLQNDAVLNRTMEVLADPAISPSALSGEYAALAKKYRLLLRRFNKTLLISDSYQSQILELNVNLNHKVEQETEKRLSHERMLAQHTRLAAMGEMISAIAHQWRQPLSTVGVIIQNIRDAARIGKLDDHYLEKAVGDAQAQIHQMSDTIDTFRGFFRPLKERRLFSVYAGINEAVALIQEQLADSGIVLDLQQPEKDDSIFGLPNEFTQTILNLLNNSIEAIIERRVNDTCSVAGRIRIAVIVDEQQIIVEVGDDGCGIPAEVAGRLFEPYFTTKGEGKGTGIGLYMSRLIIEGSMGGRLGFICNNGLTLFRIELPRVGISCPA